MNRKKHIKFAILNSPFTSAIIYIAARLYTMTNRVKLSGIEKVLENLEQGGRVIGCCWHQRFFAGFFIPRELNMPVTIMISQSDDGNFVSDVARRFGWIPVRGSSSRGGKRALREMIELVKQYGAAAHIVDGPTGPPGVIKPGVITLAQHTGAALCPVYVIYDNPWVFNSWDRFMVPRPFGRVTLHFGPLESVPESLDSESLETIRSGLEETMIREYERLDGRAR